MRRTTNYGSKAIHPIRAEGPQFDYASLAHDVRVEVGAQTAAIRELNGKSLAGRIEIGRRLAAIRKAVGRYDFRPLVASCFAWTKSTTSNYTNVARRFGTIELQCLARFDWSALVILSRKTVPQKARDEAVARAGEGQNINKALAEAIVARCRDESLPDPEAERLVNRLYQALNDFEKHQDRATQAQRDRVVHQLVASANRLNHSAGPQFHDRDGAGQDRTATVPSVILSMNQSSCLPKNGVVVQASRLRRAGETPAPQKSALSAVAVPTEPVSVGPRLAATDHESEPVARAADRPSPISEPPITTMSRSRRTFLAGIGLALAALCGRRSSAAADSSTSAPTGVEPPPIDPSPPDQGEPAGETKKQSESGPVRLRSTSASYSSGPDVTTYIYEYDASEVVIRLK